MLDGGAFGPQKGPLPASKWVSSGGTQTRDLNDKIASGPSQGEAETRGREGCLCLRAEVKLETRFPPRPSFFITQSQKGT